jgi:hypothetical protein
MKYLVSSFITLLILISLTTVGAVAAGAHFLSASDSVNSSGALVVVFDEAGLGNGNIDYTLTADATALYACFNGGPA